MRRRKDGRTLKMRREGARSAAVAREKEAHHTAARVGFLDANCSQIMSRSRPPLRTPHTPACGARQRESTANRPFSGPPGTSLS